MVRDRAWDETVGGRIRKLRESKRITIKQFAHQLTADPAQITRWEKGQDHISEGRFGDIVRVLGVAREYFTVGDDFREGVDEDNPKPIFIGNKPVRNLYMMIGNNKEHLDLDVRYVHSPIENPLLIQSVYGALEKEAQENARRAGYPYFDGPNTRLRRITLENTRILPSGHEQKGAVLELGPVSWYEYTVLNEFLDKRIFPQRGRETIRSQFAHRSAVYLSQTDLRWCQLSNILCLAMVPITSDGYGLIQVRSRSVSADPGRITSGVAENIHRYLDEAPLDNIRHRVHELQPPAIVARTRKVGTGYKPKGVPSPFLTAERGLCEEVSEGLYKHIRDNAHAVKFLSVVFDLDKFHPMLTGVIDLGITMNETRTLIERIPARDHDEFRGIEYLSLDSENPETKVFLAQDRRWVSGGLAGFAAAVGFWRTRVGNNKHPQL